MITFFTGIKGKNWRLESDLSHLPEVLAWNVQLFPVLGNGPPGNGVVPRDEQLGDLLVAQRICLVFGLHALDKLEFHFVCAHRLTAQGIKTLHKKILDEDGAIFSKDVLAARDARNG